MIGTTEKQSLVSAAQPQSGRFLMPFDLAFKKRVCVIGSEVRDQLFAGLDPVNRTLQIGPHRFRVVGVMEKQGGSFMGGPNFDRQVFIPITTFARVFGGRRGHTDVNLAIKAPSHEALADLEFEVVGEMRKVRGLRPAEPDNFSINKLDTLVGTFNNVMGVVLLVGLLVTGISLFVGAIGVMNIMLVSVTERTREIGIRKAIGATRRSILVQFLFESAAICLLGGAGRGALGGRDRDPQRHRDAGQPVAADHGDRDPGLAAHRHRRGRRAAWRGAKLDPIEALRWE